jgi:two-component system, NarL family, sensor histidine kinase UhpB
MNAWRRIIGVIFAAAAAMRRPAQSTAMTRRAQCPPARWSPLARRVVLALLPGLAAMLLALCTAARAQGADPRLVRVIAALAVESPAPQFPEDAVSAPVTLPDLWSAPRGSAPASVWYRVRFDRPATLPADTLLALAIERVCSVADVRLNGRPVHLGGRHAEPLANDCHEPQLVALPAAGLRASDNLLDVRVTGLPLPNVASIDHAGGLSALVIGPHELLANAQRWRRGAGIDAVEAVNTVLAVFGALLLGLAWVRPHAAAPRYLGAAALLWAALSARVWWHDPPLASGTVEFLVVPAYAVATALMVQFLLGHAGLRARAIEGALVAQIAVVPLSQWIAGPGQLFALGNSWCVLLVAEVAAAALLYLRVTRSQPWLDWWFMAAVLGAGSLLLAWEALVRRERPEPAPILLLYGVLPLLLIVLALRLLWGLVHALRAAEAERTALDGRVAAVALEIERKYAQVAELRVEQVTQRERKRIAADLHDDLGAKLLTIVHTSESDRISTLAREALEEMRLSVRGLTGKPMRLADALADWRAEVVSRLGQANIEIDWRGPAEETDVELPARSYVQTTRILREAVSNIIKHSGASHCKVRCAIGDQVFGVNIQDNGRGVPMELDGKLDRGHGMSSMKQRAKQMQGQCLVESGPGYGTVIRLTLPLASAP